MKNVLFFLFFLATVLLSCKIFSSLQSSTWIEAGKSFVLGEGNHGAFAATIKNNAAPEVEITMISTAGVRTALGALKKSQSTSYKVPANTKVIFKNKGSVQAELNINLTGDTSLSMTYQPN
jgi:hypothetical protein